MVTVKNQRRKTRPEVRYAELAKRMHGDRYHGGEGVVIAHLTQRSYNPRALPLVSEGGSWPRPGDQTRAFRAFSRDADLHALYRRPTRLRQTLTGKSSSNAALASWEPACGRPALIAGRVCRRSTVVSSAVMRKYMCTPRHGATPGGRAKPPNAK